MNACNARPPRPPKSGGREGSILRSGPPAARSHSLEGGLHTAEGCIQMRANALNDCNDRDRDTGSDQAVLDGSGTRLVSQETREFCHIETSCWASTLDAPQNPRRGAN